MLRFQYLYAMLQIISKAAKFQEKENPCSAYNAAYFPKFLLHYPCQLVTMVMYTIMARVR